MSVARLSSVVALVVSCSACIYAQQSGTGSLQTGYTVPTRATIVLSAVPDGTGADGVIVGSGELVRSSLATELLKRGYQVLNSSTAESTQLLEEAKSRNADLALSVHITIWEDNATSWSSKHDHAGIVLQLYDVTSQSLRGSSERLADGVSHPNQCASWLAHTAVAAMLGEVVSDEEPPC